MINYKETQELINELKADIAEFGKDEILAVWYCEEDGERIYTNYDFYEDEAPITADELENDESLTEMTAVELLEALENQLEAL